MTDKQKIELLREALEKMVINFATHSDRQSMEVVKIARAALAATTLTKENDDDHMA